MREFPEMPCQELVEVITDYLEGALPERDRIRFEEHLAVCAKCREYMEQFRRTIQAVGSVREDDAGRPAHATVPRVGSTRLSWRCPTP